MTDPPKESRTDRVKLLTRTDLCVVADIPAGAGDPQAIASRLAQPGESLYPLGESDPEVAGLHVYARSAEARETLAAEFARGEARLEFAAITQAPIWSDGSLEEDYAGSPASTRFRVTATRGSLSELALVAAPGASRQIRFHLARAGLPVVGDSRRGGGTLDGGLRLRAARLRIPSQGIDVDAAESEDFWPIGPVAGTGTTRPTLVVSRATAVALRRGHPWILPDADTSDVANLPPGSLVAVRGVGGEELGLARIEGRGRIAARMWSRSTRRSEIASVEARVAAAVKRRQRLLDSDTTDALRLIHGEADDLPGLYVDRLGPLLRVLLLGRACGPVVERVLNALMGPLTGALGADPPVVRVVHLAEPPPGDLRCVEPVRGTLDDLLDGAGRLGVREGKLRFLVDPGLGDPTRPRPGTGLFLDQRENRRRIARLARGGRWLNLFAHTGAFSAAALAGGAAEVVSVDLSSPYLAWLEANLALNDLDGPRHRSVRMDARRYLERLEREECFDGIICDPPTAARAGHRFWSVQRGGGELLAACLGRLRPGGSLLVCRNDRGSRDTLAPLLREVANAADIELADVSSAQAGPDFPRLAAFPEGDAFEGILAKRG